MQKGIFTNTKPITHDRLPRQFMNEILHEFYKIANTQTLIFQVTWLAVKQERHRNSKEQLFLSYETNYVIAD